MIPYTKKAYKLFHEGAIALTEIETNGIRIDEEYLDKALKKTAKKIKRKKEALKSSDVMKAWRKRYKTKTNFNSHEQLGKVLFDVMGYDYPFEKTAGGRYKTDESTLSEIDNPFVKDYLEVKKLQKAHGTYLMGIKREVQDGFLYPFFNLNIARTFRSSSDKPNFQNVPVRNAEMQKLVRRTVCSRHGFHLVEIDYGGVEVHAAAGYHKDPNMITYLEDSTKDMHRDAAMLCFKLSPEQMTKEIRFYGKNQFVFPEFYGSYWFDCARNLWKEAQHLKMANGKPLIKHLKKQGITELGDQDRKGSPRPGTFEAHIQKVENRFWKVDFPVYAQWKKKWYADYQKKGWFVTKTGFICQGYMKKNEVINYPVQGSAFHILLQAIIWLQAELKRRGMRSKIIAQIHDSILADVPEDEIHKFLVLAHRIMVIKLRKHWPWLITPLEIEAEVAPLNGNWHEKETVAIPS